MNAPVDVLGFGANSTDFVYTLPEFPRPDSPAAKLRISRHVVTCGGQTATALCACAALGLRAAYAGAIGSDANGRRVRETLALRGVDVTQTAVCDAPSPYAVILIDERQGERVVLWDRSPALQVPPGHVERALATPPRLLHVDDTDPEGALAAARLGRRTGIPVTSDLERLTDQTDALLETVTIRILDEHLLRTLTGETDPGRGLAALRRRTRDALSRRGLPSSNEGPDDDLWCVTLGARGAALLAGGELHQAPALEVQAVDTTGAGDVFRGAFIAAFLRGDPPAHVLRFATAAAGLSCTRLGAIDGIPAPAELQALGFGPATS